MRASAAPRSEEDFRKVLRAAGFKATPIRLALLRVLENARTPLTVEELVKKLVSPRRSLGRRGAKASPDPVTVYRATKELRDANVLRHVDLEHGHAHYELADREDHHHLVCTDCERIEDFTGCNFEDLAKSALRQSKNFKTATRHALEIFGLCNACTKKS